MEDQIWGNCAGESLFPPTAKGAVYSHRNEGSSVPHTAATIITGVSNTALNLI